MSPTNSVRTARDGLIRSCRRGGGSGTRRRPCRGWWWGQPAGIGAGKTVGWAPAVLTSAAGSAGEHQPPSLTPVRLNPYSFPERTKELEKIQEVPWFSLTFGSHREDLKIDEVKSIRNSKLKANKINSVTRQLAKGAFDFFQYAFMFGSNDEKDRRWMNWMKL